MPTFIDESGDTGPIPPSNIPFFRLAAVWVPSHDVAEHFRHDVVRLRQDQGLPAGFEFKFAKSHAYPLRREGFYRAALRHEFRFAAASVNKSGLDWDATVIHWATAVSLAACLRATYHHEEERRGKDGPLDELVVVDDNQDRQFLEVVKRVFRDLNQGSRPGQKPGAPLVGKVRFRKSHPDELLQLVDMVCGAVGCYLDGEDRWYRLIADRSVGVIELP